jgi:galactokinase
MEQVPLPADMAVVVVDSRVSRSLAETAYNERRAECAKAERLLEVSALVDVSPEDLDRARSYLSEVLYRRARHVATENERVLEGVAALRAGEVRRFGELMYESHASLRDDFEVSTPELDLLVDLASRAELVLGARLTGAGFGGCTVNLVAEGAEERFESAVVGHYRRKTGLPAEMHVCRSMGGLNVRRA